MKIAILLMEISTLLMGNFPIKHQQMTNIHLIAPTYTMFI